jgi:hypothetical protein
MTAVADLVFADEAFDAQTGTLAWEGFGRWPTAPPSSPPRNRSPRCARRRRGGRSVRVHRRLADRRRPRRRRNLARRLEPPSCPLPALISDCRRWPPSSGPTPPGNDHHPRSPRPARRAPPHASATTSALLLRDVRHGPGATLGSREVLRVLMIEEVAGRDRANRTARGVLRGGRPGKRFDTCARPTRPSPCPPKQRCAPWNGLAEPRTWRSAGHPGTGKSLLRSARHAVIDAGLRASWFSLETLTALSRAGSTPPPPES